MNKINYELVITYLKGYFLGADMTESLRALEFAQKAHSNQKRRSGNPYITHPLSMVYCAFVLGFIDNDALIAAILLHDVPEECGIDYGSLPVNPGIQYLVRLLTIEYKENEKYDLEKKNKVKEKYFHNLLNNKLALIIKALDRYSNLCEMEGIFTIEEIVKNIRETEKMLLPVLELGAKMYPNPEMSASMHILIVAIEEELDYLAEKYNIERRSV